MKDIDLGYLSWDIQMTLDECESDNVPCKYLGLGHVDADNYKSNYYPMYEIELEGFIITDLTNNEIRIRCKETGEAGVFNRDAYWTRGGQSIAEFYAKNF